MRNRKFFTKNPQYLYEILSLRQAGWSFNSLAYMYQVDRTSIRDQARKYVIIPIQRQFINPNPYLIASNLIVYIKPIEKKKPMCYADYVKLAKERKTLSPF